MQVRWSQKLNEPYIDDGNLSPDQWFANSLELDLQSTRRLESMLYEDLNPDSLGLGWMKGVNPDHRALISDQILQCVAGIEKNLIEAKLHLLEFEDFAEQVTEQFANTFSYGPNGEMEHKFPRPVSAQDHLPNFMHDLHLAGFFRAIGSAMDCLGGALIGILGLPKSVLRSDLKTARDALKKIPAQEDIRDLVELAISNAGPPGWLEWATDYRNMLVHRGRRVEFKEAELTGKLLGADGRPIPRAVTSTLLASNPAVSDIEAFRELANGMSPVIQDDALVTINDILGATSVVCELTAGALASVVESRRRTPESVVQPASQWKKPKDTEARKFVGFNNQRHPFSAEMLAGNDALVDRLIAAGIAIDHQRDHS